MGIILHIMEKSFKKYYCIDTGLLNSKKTTLTPDKGRLLENCVAIELKRRGEDLFYYMAEKVIQVVKDDEEIPKREIKSGISGCKELKVNKLEIITWNQENDEEIEGIKIKKIPLWKFLLF